MKDKICLVTGATSGIGKVTALELARMGATVIVVARDPARGQATVDEIGRATGSSQVSTMLCDFASQASIRRLAEEYRRTHDRLHVLVNNAGVILGPREVTEDGLEATFAINHIGYFLLTNLLLDVLRTSAPARVVSVASGAHMQGRLDLDDLQHERSYSAFGAYAASKLANIAWSAELARRLAGTGVTANTMHPGAVATRWGDSGSAFFRLLLKVGRPFLRNPQKGAETVIHLATSPDVEGVTGKYFFNRRPVTPSRQARDPETGRRLWEASERLVARSAAAATEAA
jgi:NAD(P)-dependent dehydrogenase (short-subunit alcohol dehydrogenase family)